VDVVIITPEPGRAKEIGQRLLALADHPHQVQWVTWPAAGFSIPLDLFAKFDADELPAPELAEAEPEPKRRRRRAKENTDDNTSEGE
jgi:hypothetical protein